MLRWTPKSPLWVRPDYFILGARQLRAANHVIILAVAVAELRKRRLC